MAKFRGQRRSTFVVVDVLEPLDNEFDGAFTDRRLGLVYALRADQAIEAALADARGMPAYIVFNDATLHEMALQRPRSANELLDIAGVGPKKLEQYGAAFLAEIGAAPIAAPPDGAMLPGHGSG